MNTSETTCCIQGIRQNGALCSCQKVQDLRAEFQKILAVSFDDAEAWLRSKQEEAKTLHAIRAEEMEAAEKLTAEARHAAIWSPRYAQGLTECVRCGGSGIWGNGVSSGTCFRCGGNGIDPRRSKPTK
jgi:DnaJ-class molecular chaperone